MNTRFLFAAIGVLAFLLGAALWFGARAPSAPVAGPVDISASALQALSFRDLRGEPRSLGAFRGQVVVLNFWATWCTPCREEMPAFVRLQTRWSGRGVQFVGIADDDREKVERFAREIGVNYPLWLGGEEVGALSRRMGNRLGVLPHTVLLDREGNVLESRIGVYPEAALEDRLREIAVKNG